MKTLKSIDEAAVFIESLVSGDLKIAAPLGLGKANQLLNKIYENFKNNNRARRLEIYTALSLDIPEVKSDLEKKILGPFLERHFGPDYPRLNYVQDLQKNKVPSHIQIHEFYFQAGQFTDAPIAQQNYISLNYTHAGKALASRGLQVIVQLIAKGKSSNQPSYSLSCNPDMTLDLYDLYKEQKENLFIIGVVHPDLPYLEGDSAVEEEFFDAILESDEINHQLFALPRNPVDAVDHMIGLHASQLVEDDGTLQIGIGSLSDALVYSVIQRHQNNFFYRQIASDFWSSRPGAELKILKRNPFEKGLYGTSEMLMDGLMHLREAQILKRFIFDQDEKKRRYLHAAFFLGSKNLYDWLRNLSGESFSGLSMTRVSKVNDLYDPHEMSLRRQRKNARFFNTCMRVNLLGAASSDTLPSGKVISGVGGQYNFVAMSQELADSRSILMLRSTRMNKGKKFSNIVSDCGQVTIPRHLRDLVVTEYGIADLQGKSDSEVITALIEISDSEFQSELMSWAKKNKKLPESYQIPKRCLHNTSRNIEEFVQKYKSANFFPVAPFGLDFTPTEYKLIKALTRFKNHSSLQIFCLLLKGLFESKNKHKYELESLNLFRVHSLHHFLQQLIVKTALSKIGQNTP